MTTDFVAHYDRWILEAAVAGFYANGYAADPEELKKAVPNVKRQHRNQSPFWAILYSYCNGRAVTLARAQGQSAADNFSRWFRQAVEDWALEQPPLADPDSIRQLSPAEQDSLRPILAEAMADGYFAEGIERSPEACLPAIDELLDFGSSIPAHILAMTAYFEARADGIRATKEPESNNRQTAAFRLAVQKFLNEWEQTQPSEPQGD